MKMIQWLGPGVCILMTMSACKQKKEEDKKYISVVSLIQEQVAHIDTSLYVIRKIVIHDSLHSDTSFIPREKFREEATEFLKIPDLGDKKVARHYTEEPAVLDQTLNRVIIDYLAKDPDEEFRKQELLVTPNAATGDKVNTLIINRVSNTRNGFLKKDMLWQMDKSFQVVTTTQLPGQPEKVTTTKVTWNEDTDQ